MACRYHKLPSDLLKLELNDFNLNSIILLKAVERQNKKDTENSNNKWSDINMHKGNKNLSTFGLAVSTKDKGAK